MFIFSIKRTGKLFVFIISIILFHQILTADAKSGELRTETEKQSYTIGLDIGREVKRFPIEIDIDSVILGIMDKYNDKELRLSSKEISEIQMNVQKKMKELNKKRFEELAKKNEETGEKFLKENKKKEGIKTLKSGLQYLIIKKGNGKKPKLEDTISINYRGTTITGKEFDSSYRRGEPDTFPLKGLIKGWVEALQLMPVGSKWKLFIPSDLAYGERGYGREIGPNETLIFEVELILIVGNKK